MISFLVKKDTFREIWDKAVFWHIMYVSSNLSKKCVANRQNNNLLQIFESLYFKTRKMPIHHYAKKKKKKKKWDDMLIDISW